MVLFGAVAAAEAAAAAAAIVIAPATTTRTITRKFVCERMVLHDEGQSK